MPPCASDEDVKMKAAFTGTRGRVTVLRNVTLVVIFNVNVYL